MDRGQVVAVAKAAGLPVAYAQWKAGNDPPMPYIVYRYSYSNDLIADNVNYIRVSTWQIELYSERKDEKHEDLLEAAIRAKGWSFEKREYTFSDPKQYLETLYIIKTIG